MEAETLMPPPQPEEGRDGAQWLLRQLRPVSYSFRKGAESKYMRFGFLADELESVVPNVVRTTKAKEFIDQKAVQYQDLIALLASAAQSQQQKIEVNQHRLALQEDKIQTLREKMAMLRRLAAELAAPSTTSTTTAPHNSTKDEQFFLLREQLSELQRLGELF